MNIATSNKIFWIKYKDMTTEELVNRYLNLSSFLERQFRNPRTRLWGSFQLKIIHREIDWILKTLESRDSDSGVDSYIDANERCV